MILGIGTDIVRNLRIKNVIKRAGERFTNRVFTPEEVAYCEEKKTAYIHYAARFAAKEAVIKALDLEEYVNWKNIAVEKSPLGKPSIKLTGRAEEIFKSKNGRTIHLSISHEREFSVAYAVIESS